MIKSMAVAAKAASKKMEISSLKQKNDALKALTLNLKDHQETILHANRKDIASAKANGLSIELLERLSLENRLEGIIHDLKSVIELSDPIGELFDEQLLPNHLKIAKRRIPIGVLGVIYESRPNVTLDISALCIKSGNCALLRGGSETLYTNRILVEIVQRSLSSADLPIEAIQFIDDADRAKVNELLQLHDFIDLIIPRGSAALQQYCRDQSKIPVITGGIGICHLFVDESADLERSLEVILNAKTQRPTVCNALDTLLVHRQIAPLFIPRLIDELGRIDVMFRLDPRASQIVQNPRCSLAEPDDWNTEWLSLVLGIKVVDDIEEALAHIHQHSSGHSDGILSENIRNAELFVKAVDSAAVYVNASTRFTDGGQLGLGAEVAISTQKLHARGPMGLKELTSYKWIIRGEYHVRN